jgi:hypothetical protein
MGVMPRPTEVTVPEGVRVAEFIVLRPDRTWTSEVCVIPAMLVPDGTAEEMVRWYRDNREGYEGLRIAVVLRAGQDS